MARKPEFDREAVVRSAMAVFWADGFHAASMSRLGPAMGLRPGSIYAAFGSKEALFREVLDVYVADIRNAAAEVSDPHALLKGWFAAHIKRSQQGQRGCLLLNTSTEVRRMDAESASAVKGALDAMEAFFVATVKKARGRAGAPTPRATARLLIAALAGISTLSRTGAADKTLRDVAEAALVLV